MVSRRHDVIILHNEQTEAFKLSKAFRVAGYGCRSVAEISAIVENSSELTDPIIVNYVHGGPSVTVDQTRDLVAAKSVHTFPLILVGQSASQCMAPLRKIFRSVRGVESPCDPDAVLGALDSICRELDAAEEEFELPGRRKTPSSGAEPGKVIDKRGSPREGGEGDIGAGGGEGATPSSEGAAAPPRSGNGLSKLLFKVMLREDTEARTLGGDRYPSLLDEAAFTDMGHLPRDSKASLLVATMCEGLGTWERLHLGRVAYLVNCMGHGLELADEPFEVAKALSFLQASAWSPTEPRLFHREILRDPEGEGRKVVGKAVQESALKLSQDPDLKSTAKAAMHLSSLLKGEAVEEGELFLVASAVHGAGLVDRACWNAKLWNSAAAYRILTACKRGELDYLAPPVVCMLIKILAEAVSTAGPSPVDTYFVNGNPEMVEVARKLREGPIDRRERRVTLHSLVPGMCLSRPLFAHNGTQVLESNVRLDDDLICRIWNLSSILPLNPALIYADRDFQMPYG
jgi:hypothetical protein